MKLQLLHFWLLTRFALQPMLQFVSRFRLVYNLAHFLKLKLILQDVEFVVCKIADLTKLYLVLECLGRLE